MLFLLTSMGVKAGNPGWSVNPYAFQYSMTTTGVLLIDHVESVDTADVIGAFVGTECRGMTKPIYISSTGRYIAFLMIYSNASSGENISFKMYNSSENTIVNATQSISFVPNNTLGLITNPYIWSNTTLGVNANFLSFSVPQQITTAVIDTAANTVKVTVPQGTNLASLTSSFTLSPYSKARVNGVIQQSGLTSNNFSSSLIYTITAENPAYTKNWTVTVSYCEPVTIATVGSTQTLCSTLNSGPLGGNTPTVGTGLWSIVSGGTGTFTSQVTGNSTFTANNYGTFVLRWTISNGLCNPSTADLVINFYQSPSNASVGATQNRCGTLVSTSLGGNTPTSGVGSWSIVSGGTGTFSSINSGNSTFTADSSKTYVLRWTIHNGTCTNTTADVTINYYATTLAQAGADQNLCNATYAYLNGNTPAVGTGAWSFVSGPSTAVIFPVPGASSIAVGLVSGATPYVFRYSITNGPCTANVDDVVINIAAPSVVNAGVDQTICRGSVATMNANISSFTTLAWTSSGTGAFSSNSVLNPVYIPSLNDLSNGSVQLTLTASNGGCSGVSDQMTLSFYQSTNSPTGNAVQSLSNSSTVGNIVVVGSNIKWYDASTNGNLLSNSALLENGKTYYASQTVGGCESQTRLAVLVNLQYTKTVHLYLFLEGLFDANTRHMNPCIDGNTGEPKWSNGIADQIQVDLIPESGPYSLEYAVLSVSGVNLTAAGLASFEIPSIHSGNYYIRITNRNHLETWSAIPVSFNSSIINYNFTTSLHQAYGSNPQALLSISPDVYGFFLGDLNQSGYIDLDDFVLFEPDLTLGSTGFLTSDFNGGGYVDLDDFVLFEPRLTIGNVSEIPY